MNQAVGLLAQARPKKREESQNAEGGTVNGER